VRKLEALSPDAKPPYEFVDGPLRIPEKISLTAEAPEQMGCRSL
jgi:hypothetical protein